MKQIRNALFGLVVLFLIALAVAGRTAVNRTFDYKEMTAAKSLHQLTLETRADEDDRGGTLLFGVALGLAALTVFGVMLFAMNSGREFGRRAGKCRRRTNRTAYPALPSEAPAMRALPHAPILPSLPPPAEGHYEDRR